FLKEIMSGDVQINAFNWPAFCYGQGRAYNAHNPNTALFKLEFLVRAWKHIFLGLGMEETKLHHSSRPTVAALCKLTSVTGRTIAYATTHVCFTLSDAQEFSPIDLHFNYKEFYYAIMMWFKDDPEDELVNEMIAWWNK
ncbi:hypothetical protein L208DRAFT_1210488, partial [Tricholoma matsutake]